MIKGSISLILLLSATMAEGAPQLKELLKEVNPNKAQKITEYNSVFLQPHLYFAARHRIVKADIKLLLKDDDFTITPFDDMEPLHIKQKKVERKVDIIYWDGQIQAEFPPQFEAYKDSYLPITVSAHAWDLDESGNAHSSSKNRFKHSPHWNIDEYGTPILEKPPEGESAIAGPPPKTPEDIEWHKKLKRLKKHQFYSVRAIFNSPDGKKYLLLPLKYTPKYSVIYEKDPYKNIFTQFDRMPGEPDTRSEDEKLRIKEFNAFNEGLPKEINKAVKGEIK